MTFRSVLKTAAKVFLGLFLSAALVVALLLAWVKFVNRHDEPLTPEAQAILSYRAEEVPEMENGYVALAGFTAPAGSDWKRVGAERIRRHNEGVDQEKGEKNAGMAEEKLEFVGGNEEDPPLKLGGNFSDAELQASLRELPRQAEKIESLLKDNAELVERYESILALPAFREPWSVSIHISHFFNFTSDTYLVQNLLLAKTSLTALEGDVRPLLDFLERDMRFWRRAAMRSDTLLVTTLVAQVPLRDDIRLLRVLLPRVDVSNPETVERLRVLLAPLSPDERSLGRVYENEWQRNALFYMNIEEESRKACEYVASSTEEKIDCSSSGMDFFGRWSYQPQATVNRYARHAASVRGLMRLTPKEFAERASSGMNDHRREGEENSWEWLKPYNFTGRLLADIVSAGFYEQFGSLRYDIAAALQLLRAQLELRLAGVDAEKNPRAVPEFLARAGEETRNPYTEAPFDWDEDCRRLSFTPQDAHRRLFSEITLADIPEQNVAACAKPVQERK